MNDKQVVLPELPKPSIEAFSDICAKRNSEDFYTADQMREYGTLCYEAGLAAGRGQAGQSDTDARKRFELWHRSQWPVVHACWKAGDLQHAHDPDIVTEEDIEDMFLAYSAALKQSLAQPARQPMCEMGKAKERAWFFSNDEIFIDVEYKTDKLTVYVRERETEKDIYLEQPAPAQSAPVASLEGWKLVPIKATDSIKNARVFESSLTNEVAWDTYLAAAPSPPIEAQRDDLAQTFDEWFSSLPNKDRIEHWSKKMGWQAAIKSRESGE